MGPGFFGGFCFASFSRACSSFSPWDSMWSFAAAATFLLALFAELGLRDTLSRSALIRLSLMGHILRAGRQQIVNLTTREAINKRDSHIPIEQQALARVEWVM